MAEKKKKKDKKPFNLYKKFKELEKIILNEIGQKHSSPEAVNLLSATYVNLTTAVAGSFSIDIGQARQKALEDEWKAQQKTKGRIEITGLSSNQAAEGLVITDPKKD